MADRSLDTETWLERIRLDEPGALAEMFDHYRPRLRKMVRMRMDDRLATRVDPSDVLQDVYLDAQRQVRQYLREPKVAIYVSAKQGGNLLYLSGHGPMVDGKFITGKVGADLDIEAAQEAARQTGLNLLATTRRMLGSLDSVRGVIKVLGMVNAVPDFTDHPTVINGFSDLMVDVFGEAIGKHARSAVGMGSLPGRIPVEIEMILEVEA